MISNPIYGKIKLMATKPPTSHESSIHDDFFWLIFHPKVSTRLLLPSCSAMLENFHAIGPERQSCWGPGTRLPSLSRHAGVSPHGGSKGGENSGFHMDFSGKMRSLPGALGILTWDFERSKHWGRHLPKCGVQTAYNAEFTQNAPWRLRLKCFSSGKTSWEISH